MPYRTSPNLQNMPLGPNHPMEKKLSWAHLLYDSLGEKIKKDQAICSLLHEYHKTIHASWQAMKRYGVVEECTRCALQDGGSCCGQGIENKFDIITLLINLLSGVSLPAKPWDLTGCWFLGEKGCLLVARHVICVNFVCKRLYAAIPSEKIQLVQKAMQAETDAGFILEEYLKGWLIRHER